MTELEKISKQISIEELLANVVKSHADKYESICRRIIDVEKTAHERISKLEDRIKLLEKKPTVPELFKKDLL